jgi:hypothetical protein
MKTIRRARRRRKRRSVRVTLGRKNNMESGNALKKILNVHMGSYPLYTSNMLKKMSRVDLALAAARQAIWWGNIHINSLAELEEFKTGLIKIAEEQK